MAYELLAGLCHAVAINDGLVIVIRFATILQMEPVCHLDRVRGLSSAPSMPKARCCARSRLSRASVTRRYGKWYERRADGIYSPTGR